MDDGTPIPADHPNLFQTQSLEERTATPAAKRRGRKPNWLLLVEARDALLAQVAKDEATRDV